MLYGVHCLLWVGDWAPWWMDPIRADANFLFMGKKKRPSDRTLKEVPTEEHASIQPTKVENFARFLVLHTETPKTPLSKLSPFPVQKGC